jgi:hypothetical protein
MKLTKAEIDECLIAWEVAEMSDLELSHLNHERLKLYHKWFRRLLTYAIEVGHES